MTAAAIVLDAGGTAPAGRRRSSSWAARAAAAALRSGLDEVIVVVDAEERAAGLPDGVTVLLDAPAVPGEAAALRAALDWSARMGHAGVVVARPEPGRDDAALDPGAWRALAAAPGGPVVLATRGGQPAPLSRIDAEAWPLLPLEGPLSGAWQRHPELVSKLATEAGEPGAGAGAS